MTAFSPGSIVRARGREWIVQPDLAPPLYTLMPLGSTSDEAVRVHAGLEPVASATFAPPDPSRRGDANACRLLRDAARLATRHAAGPFRSFGRLGFEPRPYQLVPLIMALRLDPVRLLIADDVGIGKTIEALMIARELYDRREVPGFSVLCPPHLAPQWKAELDKRFHIDAELVLASTAQQLERRLAGTETIFQRFPFTVTSLDYVKSERRRREFLQSCPDLVIVDEAHTCTPTGGAGRAARQMRHELLKGLARKEGQHLLLVTATPHSGNHEAYDALLGLLDERFGPGGALSREGSDPKARDRELSRHFIQRRRPDIAAYLGDTRFPQRAESEVAYRLSTVMQALVEDVAAFAERYRQAEASRQVQRTRAWAILTLFQAIASSPAAAAATLAVRSAGAEKAQEGDEGAAGAEEQFARPLVDDFLDENDGGDATPSVADFEQEAAREGSAAAMSREARKVFASLARRAAEVSAADDTKLLALQKFLKQHLAKEGNADGGVVVFCRFIATAEYLQRELAKALGSRALVECVVGTMHDSDRTARIEAMAEATEGDGRARVLVCTDCLSEGINLQDAFDTVVHYDLSWNPNRHVQREGRVDRFGQPRERVHVCFFHSEQTVFDQVVMGVLHRKRREIASELGYLVSVPVSRDALLGLILKRASEARRVDRTGWLFSEADLQRADVDAFERECDAMVKAEKALRLRFNQHQIKPEEVEEQVRRVKAALGTGSVEGFTLDSLRRSGLVVEPRPGGGYRLQAPPDASPAVREVVDSTLAPNRQPPPAEHRVRFEDRSMGQALLTRAHPLVEGLASFVLQSALDPLLVDAGGRAPVAARCGVVATRDVEARTTILVLRTRCQVEAEQRGGGRAEPMLAEDVFALGLEGDLAHPTRIDAERAARLVEAKPAGNLDPARAQRLLEQALAALPDVQQLVRTVAAERAAELARAHDAARSGRKGVAPTRATPTGEPDVLGVFILVPQQAGSAAHGGVA